MGVPTKYRMAKDDGKSCATCAYYNKLNSACNKFITYVDSGATCDDWTMGTKQAEAVIRRATGIIKRGLNPLAAMSAFDYTNLAKDPEGTATDALGKMWSGSTALEQGAKGVRRTADTVARHAPAVARRLPAVAKHAPVVAKTLQKTAPVTRALGKYAPVAGGVLGGVVTGMEVDDLVNKNPITGERSRDMAGNINAHREQSIANSTPYSGGAAQTFTTGKGLKELGSNAFQGWSNPVKSTAAVLGGISDINQERIDQREAQGNIAQQTEQAKQKQYQMRRDKAYANAPSQEARWAQIDKLKATRQPAQPAPAPAPAQKSSVPVPAEQPAAPKPQPQVAQTPQPQPYKPVMTAPPPVAQTSPPKPPKPTTPTPPPPQKNAMYIIKAACDVVLGYRILKTAAITKKAQHTRACECGRVSDTYYDICPVCQPKLDAKAATYLRSVSQRIKSATTAKQVAQAAAKTDTKPTEDQKESGNYKKGHIKIHGMDITIENPKGSMRSGESKAGKKWSTKMTAHYGYIKRTESEADGDHVDVFIGPDPKSWLVYIVDQVNPKTRAFDEHKCILGCKTEAEAKKLYLSNYEKGWKGLSAVKFMIIPQFKRWLEDGDTGKPVAKRAEVKPMAPPTPQAASITPPPANVIPQSSEIVDANSLPRDQAFQTPPVDPNKTTPPVKTTSLKPTKVQAKSLTTKS